MRSILKNTLASAAMLALGLATAPALAQTNGGFDDLSGDSNSNEVFGGSDVTLTDIMGNLRRADGLSSDQFNRQSDRNINEAATDFRRRQQEAIEAQQDAAVETPIVEEQL
ncbi:MAG: hypothetical protein AAF959_19475 [Cyanobacteria bacterium P01_D01_bin.56]